MILLIMHARNADNTIRYKTETSFIEPTPSFDEPSIWKGEEFNQSGQHDKWIETEPEPRPNVISVQIYFLVNQHSRNFSSSQTIHSINEFLAISSQKSRARALINTQLAASTARLAQGQMYEAHETEWDKSNNGGEEAKSQELKKSYRVHHWEVIWFKKLVIWIISIKAC